MNKKNGKGYCFLDTGRETLNHGVSPLRRFLNLPLLWALGAALESNVSMGKGRKKGGKRVRERRAEPTVPGKKESV